MIRKLLSNLTLMLILSGCFSSLEKAENAVDRTQANSLFATINYGSGLEAYKNTVYKLATSHCVSCHGTSTQPQFAVSNLANAYDAMLSSGKINFNNIASSSLLARGGKLDDAHCGSYCSGGAAIPAWQSAIQAWWYGGECLKTNSCSQGGGSGSGNNDGGGNQAGRIKTLGKIVPANLPSAAGTFATMTFPLNEVNNELAGASFVIDIQQYGSSNGYLIRRPRITFATGTTFSVYVRDIKVVINGVLDPNATTFEVVERIVSPPGGQFLSLSTLLTTMDKGIGVDQLAISFAEAARGSATCKALASFTANVKPLLISQCAGCHGGQTTFRINAADTDDLMCSRALQRVDLARPDFSPLIRLPRHGDIRRDGSRHPTVGGLTDANVTSILNWIDVE